MSEKIKIIIVMEGGVVQRVVSNDVSVICNLIDHDELKIDMTQDEIDERDALIDIADSDEFNIIF